MNDADVADSDDNDSLRATYLSSLLRSQGELMAIMRKKYYREITFFAEEPFVSTYAG